MQLTIKQVSDLCGKTIQTVHYWVETGLPADWFRKDRMKPQYTIQLCELEKWLTEKGKKNVIKTLKKNLRNKKTKL